MTVTAIIVARKGSTRLPGKALLPFAGTTIVGHKVQTLKKCPDITEVVIGSDGPAILEEGAKYGATPVLRDDYHCNESICPANEMLHDMAVKVDCDVIVWAHPTNPLVVPETFTRAINAFLQDIETREYDSLCSVSRVQCHAWVDGKPINYDPWAPRHTLAKDVAPVYFQNGAIFIQRREDMLRNSYFFGDRPRLFPLSDIESIDIDTEKDYNKALKAYEEIYP